MSTVMEFTFGGNQSDGYWVHQRQYNKSDDLWTVEPVAWFVRKDQAESYISLSNRHQGLANIV